MTSSTPRAPVAPIALGPGEGEALWAFGCLVTVKASGARSGGASSVLEHLAARGAGSPLHVHRNEDEWFYVMEGELTFSVGSEVIRAGAGGFVFGPRDVPHTFTVSSETARFLLVAEPGGLDGMMRALGEPAPSLSIPPPSPGPPDMRRVAEVCASYGIEMLGPPGIPA